MSAPPARIGARISPDGTSVAYLAPWRDRLNVVVRDLDGDWPSWSLVPCRNALHGYSDSL